MRRQDNLACMFPTNADPASSWEEILSTFEPPVLLISTHVGRGMYTLGEAVRERFPMPENVVHFPVEQFLPGRAVAEDLKRYQWLTNHVPFVMHAIYRVPVFYYRKYLRERFLSGTDLARLQDVIERVRPRTVLCISHRPAFWVSILKKRTGLDFRLWGLLGEYGNTLGWKYIFWGQMDGFLSPLLRHQLTYSFSNQLDFRTIALPARKQFEQLKAYKGDRTNVLLVCGYWGQGPILKIVKELLGVDGNLSLQIVCGDNTRMLDQVRHWVHGHRKVFVHGAVPSLIPFLKEAGCVITKPGISTLLEAHSAGRKLFLVKGIPVAEDNNARYAIRHFGASWFSPRAFDEWRRSADLQLESPRLEAA